MPIEISDLNFSYHKESILQNINLIIPDNKIVALVGLNGQGKSTIIKLIIGFLKPQKGSIKIDGINLEKISSHSKAKIMAYVPQKMEIGYRFNVSEFIKLGATFLNLTTTKLNSRLNEVLTKLNISHLANRYIDELSGGELRLIYLARALIQDTKWLILDEPTSSLDFKREYEFLDILKKSVTNKSIVSSIHNPKLAMEYADIIVVLSNKQIVNIINTDDHRALYEAFSEIYSKEFTDKIMIREE